MPVVCWWSSVGPRDEYAQADPARDMFLGGTLGASVSPAQVTWDGIGPNGSEVFAVTGPARAIDIIDPQTTDLIARYDNGEAAAIRVDRNFGKVWLIGFDLGTQYANLGCDDVLPGELGSYPTSYDEKVRAAMLHPLSNPSLGITRPAWADHPLVEVVHLMKASIGVNAVALINYAGVNDVTVTVPNLPACTSAQTLFGGQSVTFVNNEVTVPIGDVEVIAWQDCSLPIAQRL